eukprot:TRINITY_DN14905_c0_g1_i3.p1 TRINITY_DN14905_c0_g1~~TRINITY_DN14905_c0_g1_i3.p1  ORF type:complete len:773 (+),score=123.96 TRINITY_DN14905_c0_g1_i3:158-2476(+)
MAASEAAINETDVSESPALVEGEGASPAGPSQPPRRLIISRSTGDIPGTGTYEQVDEELVHGFPHWKHVEGDFWLFSGADGKWYVGDAEEKRQGFESVTGLIASNYEHAGELPHDIGAWQWLDKSSWVDDPDVRVVAVDEQPAPSLAVQGERGEDPTRSGGRTSVARNSATSAGAAAATEPTARGSGASQRSAGGTGLAAAADAAFAGRTAPAAKAAGAPRWYDKVGRSRRPPMTKAATTPPGQLPASQDAAESKPQRSVGRAATAAGQAGSAQKQWFDRVGPSAAAASGRRGAAPASAAAQGRSGTASAQQSPSRSPTTSRSKPKPASPPPSPKAIAADGGSAAVPASAATSTPSPSSKGSPTLLRALGRCAHERTRNRARPAHGTFASTSPRKAPKTLTPEELFVRSWEVWADSLATRGGAAQLLPSPPAVPPGLTLPGSLGRLAAAARMGCARLRALLLPSPGSMGRPKSPGLVMKGAMEKIKSARSVSPRGRAATGPSAASSQATPRSPRSASPLGRLLSSPPRSPPRSPTASTTPRAPLSPRAGGLWGLAAQKLMRPRDASVSPHSRTRSVEAASRKSPGSPGMFFGSLVDLARQQHRQQSRGRQPGSSTGATRAGSSPAQERSPSSSRVRRGFASPFVSQPDRGDCKQCAVLTKKLQQWKDHALHLQERRRDACQQLKNLFREDKTSLWLAHPDTGRPDFAPGMPGTRSSGRRFSHRRHYRESRRGLSAGDRREGATSDGNSERRRRSPSRSPPSSPERRLEFQLS